MKKHLVLLVLGLAVISLMAINPAFGQQTPAKQEAPKAAGLTDRKSTV